MSFKTLYYIVSISKDKLLNLLLGQGDLILGLNGQKPITIYEFSDRRGFGKVCGVSIHAAKIRGQSEDPNVSYVDGTVSIIPKQDCEVYKCTFELFLQDHFE